jgi:hypothetical protein
MENSHEMECGSECRWVILLYRLMAVMFMANCDNARRDASADGSLVVFEKQGKIPVVRTVSGSSWGVPMQLVEDIRIGSPSTSGQPILGSVEAVAEDSSGGLYVFDSKGPVLMYYDSTGRLVRTIGRKGSGPGEYREIVDGMAVRKDGRLILRDSYNGRLTLYDPNGVASDHWPLGSQLSAPRSLTVDTADHTYLRILWQEPEPGAAWEFGLLHLNQEGRFVDSLRVPSVPGERQFKRGPFQPSKLWAFSPHSYFVAGINDFYHFDIVSPTGSRVRVERVVDQVRLNSEERAEWEAIIEWGRARLPPKDRAALASVPHVKPAYKALAFGPDHRIWVLRHVAAIRDSTFAGAPNPNRSPVLTWHEPEVWDVFQENGSYLGEVRAPLGTGLILFGTKHVWGIQNDGQSSYVVRFRIEPTGDTRPRQPVTQERGTG